MIERAIAPYKDQWPLTEKRTFYVVGENDTDLDGSENSQQPTVKTSSSDNVLVGLIDNETFTDTLYVRRESILKYKEEDC